MPAKKSSGKILGLDQGFKKLLALSDGHVYGKQLAEIYNKISKCIQGSKRFKRLLIHRTNEINRTINNFFNENNDLYALFIEDLKNVKKNSKLHRKTMNKVQR